MDPNALDAVQRLIAGDLDALIFERSPHYVQFAIGRPGTLIVESVGEANLEKRLTPDQLRRLHDFGFAPPARNGSGNHSMEVPADAAAAVTLALQILVEVYGADPSEVTLTEV